MPNDIETNAQKLTKLNEKIVTLKALIHQDDMAKAQLAAQNRISHRQDKMDKNSEQSKDLWDNVDKRASEMVEEGIQGFDNFISSMSKILQFLMMLRKAINASDPVGGLFNQAINYVEQGILALRAAAPSLREYISSSPENKHEELTVLHDGLIRDAKARLLNVDALENNEPPTPRP